MILLPSAWKELWRRWQDDSESTPSEFLRQEILAGLLAPLLFIRDMGAQIKVYSYYYTSLLVFVFVFPEVWTL